MTEQKTTWITNGLLVGEIIAVLTAFFFFQSQIQAQSQRSDDLYREFIALVKETKRHE